MTWGNVISARAACKARRRHPEPANGLSFEIELDQHRGLVSRHPPVVPRLDSDKCGPARLLTYENHHSISGLRSADRRLHGNRPPPRVRLAAAFE